MSMGGYNMSVLDYLRAKDSSQENYLLKDHIKETVQRAVDLKKFVNENRNKIQYDKLTDEFFKNLIIACFLHDLGKIDYTFQKKVFGGEEFKNVKDFLKEESANVDVNDHEVISLLYLKIFDGAESDKWMGKIGTAILLHHYNDFYTNRQEIDISEIIREYPDLQNYVVFLQKNRNKVEEILKELIAYIKESVKDEFVENTLTELEQKINFDRLNDFSEGDGLAAKLILFNPHHDLHNNDSNSYSEWYDFFVFLGCLRRCDYSASGNVEIEYQKKLIDVFGNLNGKIKEKINSNLWQEELLKHSDDENLILIAPTGSGKTEFALLWAKNRGKKLIYTLPLRVALNDLYNRFANEKNGYFKQDDLRILHSTSFIEYLDEEKDGKNLSIDEKQTTSRLFSSPLMLTTPDQVFLSSIKYYGFDKLYSIYPVSSVVIDEIQAYNPEMAAVIIKTIKDIQQLKGNVLIITATFPPYFEELFNKDNNKLVTFKKIDIVEEKEKGTLNVTIKNNKLKRHTISFIDKPLFEYDENKKPKPKNIEDIKGILNANREKNVLITVNNVGKAIQLFKDLESEFAARLKIEDRSSSKRDDILLLLLHSRLLEKEKARRVNIIKNSLKERKKGMIVISTQIVEASVDIDFDVLITEMSPIDSQIQRWGRIYRNRSEDYKGERPNIYIFSSNDKGTFAIYDKDVISTTEKKIKEVDPTLVLDYKDEIALIRQVFSEKVENEYTLKDKYVSKIEENLKWLEYTSAEKRSEAQGIFRRIAGLQVVFADLIDGEELENKLAEILKNENIKDLSINEIVKKMEANQTNRNLKWEVLRILYEHSVNIPIFAFGNLNKILKNTVGGFAIITTGEIGCKKEEIVDYGIIDIKNLNIDEQEIEESENVII